MTVALELMNEGALLSEDSIAFGDVPFGLYQVIYQDGAVHGRPVSRRCAPGLVAFRPAHEQGPVSGLSELIRHRRQCFPFGVGLRVGR